MRKRMTPRRRPRPRKPRRRRTRPIRTSTRRRCSARCSSSANNEPAVDESALRYYASLHNFARANAEIKRLKALHPNWTPPTNIYSSAGAGADEQAFWDMLAADRLEELRSAMALKERKQPGWKPSRDLVTKIERKAAIEELTRKSNEKKPAEALAVADRDPSVLHCAYMDANWRIADAFLDVGLPKRAFEIYHAIIAQLPRPRRAAGDGAQVDRALHRSSRRRR